MTPLFDIIATGGIELGREPVIRRSADSKPEYISCTICAWGVAVVATRSLNIDGEISQIFEGHDCTIHPKCHVAGCTEAAAFGFREYIDGNTLTTSGFRVGDCPNWCLKHDAKMREEYAGVNGRFVDLRNA